MLHAHESVTIASRPTDQACATHTLAASGVAVSENLRKRMTVNHIAINVRMANGTVIPMNWPMLMTLVSSCAIPAARRFVPSVTVKTSIIDASR